MEVQAGIRTPESSVGDKSQSYVHASLLRYGGSLIRLPRQEINSPYPHAILSEVKLPTG